MKLYKYVTADRADILSRGMMRFTQPKEFNDPFELSDTVNALVGRDTNPVEAALNASKIGKSILDTMGQVIGSGLQGYFSDQWGVLTLTEEPDNLLMWAHYADDHQGFVIEFDGGHPFFDRRQTDEERFRRLHKVTYSEVRRSSPLKEYNAMDALLRKSVEWEYEHEWRMIVPLDESDEKIEAPVPIHLFSVPPECITGLILGCRTSEVDRSRLLEVVVDGSRYAHIDVRQAALHESAFRLTLTESPWLHAKHVEKAVGEGDFAIALKHANRALECAPKDDAGRFYGLRALVHANLKNEEAFASDLAELKRLDPQRYERMLNDPKFIS